MLNRRSFVTSGALGLGVAAFPGAGWAAPGTNKKFVFIIQRGAAGFCGGRCNGDQA
ncbi:hypothetical protein [Sphingorhabdus sp.]|uniref:hypothetical protein n=1 Tax=Sphingorhabdus sp. TaxID=1902408 RepID=UPI0039BC7E8B